MKSHFSSFLSFLKKRMFPSFKDLSSLRDDPFSPLKGIVITLFLCALAILLSLFLRISNTFMMQTPAKGGTITEGVIGAPRYINPLLATSTTDTSLTGLVFAGLMKKNDAGTLTPVLAQECTQSPDGFTAQCVLPDKQIFSDKSPLTSADVVFTIETKKAITLQRDPENAWASVVVSAPDERTVIIRATNNAKALSNALTLGIVPKKLWGSIPLESIEDSTTNMNPIGAGAFVVSDITITNSIPTEVLLTPNHHFSGIKPFVRALVIRSYANQLDLKTALYTGEITSTSALKGTFIDEKIRDDYTITQVPTNTSVVLFVSSSERTSAKAQILASISELIDRNQIIDTIENGYGIALLPTGSSSRITPTAPISIAIAVQKDDDLIRTAELLSTELRAFGILSTVNVFDQGTFLDQVQLGQYSFVLTTTLDAKLGYQHLIPLYTKSVPHITARTIHTTNPSMIESSPDSLREASLWYARTDAVWKWFLHK